MSFPVQIITPEKVAMETRVDFVVVPAIDGELGILSHHAPLLAQLQSGEIRLRTGEVVERLAVSGGFVEVRSDRVSIFVETAELAHEIDLERARQAAARAKAALENATTDLDLAMAETALRRALTRLRVFGEIRRSQRSSQPVS